MRVRGRTGRLLMAALVCGASLLLADDKAKPDATPQDQRAPASTRHWPHIRLVGISVGASYTRFSGFPYLYSPYYYSAAYPYPYWLGFYDFYSPLHYSAYHPGFYSGFARGPEMGEVRLLTQSREAEVLLDGAYAGTADKLKSMWLEPGAYNLEVKARNGEPFSKRIYVLSGKTLRIDATPGLTQ